MFGPVMIEMNMKSFTQCLPDNIIRLSDDSPQMIQQVVREKNR